MEAGAPNYSGIATIDPNGDAAAQLTVIVDDMEAFFTEFLSGCTKPRETDGKTTLVNKVERIQRYELKLSEALTKYASP